MPWPGYACQDGFDDDRFRMPIDLGDEVVHALGLDLHLVDVQRSPVDDRNPPSRAALTAMLSIGWRVNGHGQFQWGRGIRRSTKGRSARQASERRATGDERAVQAVARRLGRCLRMNANDAKDAARATMRVNPRILVRPRPCEVFAGARLVPCLVRSGDSSRFDRRTLPGRHAIHPRRHQPSGQRGRHRPGDEGDGFQRTSSWSRHASPTCWCSPRPSRWPPGRPTSSSAPASSPRSDDALDGVDLRLRHRDDAA